MKELLTIKVQSRRNLHASLPGIVSIHNGAIHLVLHQAAADENGAWHDSSPELISGTRLTRTSTEPYRNGVRQ
jgi:hypothetical protein